MAPFCGLYIIGPYKSVRYLVFSHSLLSLPGRLIDYIEDIDTESITEVLTLSTAFDTYQTLLLRESELCPTRGWSRKVMSLCLRATSSPPGTNLILDNSENSP